MKIGLSTAMTGPVPRWITSVAVVIMCGTAVQTYRKSESSHEKLVTLEPTVARLEKLTESIIATQSKLAEIQNQQAVALARLLAIYEARR